MSVMQRFVYSRTVQKVASSQGVACEQALLFGCVKRVSQERASEQRSREGPLGAELACRLAWELLPHMVYKGNVPLDRIDFCPLCPKQGI